MLDYLEDEWEKEEPDASKRWFKLAKVDVEKNPRLKTVSFGSCRSYHVILKRGLLLRETSLTYLQVVHQKVDREPSRAAVRVEY